MTSMNDIQYLAPARVTPEELAEVAPLPPFAQQTLGFIDALSRRLLQRESVAAYPELAALGFWMRRANLARLQQRFRESAGEAIFMPRGTAFHIAPSNVDSIFVYSWFLSMLCGNRNIVRLSSRSSPQLDMLIGALDALLAQAEWRDIARRTMLVRYDRDPEKNAYFSGLCDVRIIWGGNATVSEIRRAPLPPFATEAAFAGKFSLALIKAGAWNAADGAVRQEWQKRFFNDVYWFGQMACSSPRLVVWHGDAEVVSRAQESFWTGFSEIVRQKGTALLPVHYVDKRVAEDLIAQRVPEAVILPSPVNDISRVQLPVAAIKPVIDADLHCGSGLFYETSVDTLDALVPLLDRRIQTISYAGYPGAAELREFVSSRVLGGIDRIVPFGQALEFSPTWDGVDLFRVFLRQIDVR